jgi:hypothetical protein
MNLKKYEKKYEFGPRVWMARMGLVDKDIGQCLMDRIV